MYIREARYEEIPQILKRGKAFEEATKKVVVNIEYATEVFQNLYKSGMLTMLRLLEDDDTPIGGLAYIITPDCYTGDMLGVELYWFVFSDKRGYGHKLVDAFEKSAKSKGCNKVAMIHLVDSFPDTLKAFYEKRGYSLVELHYVKEI